MTTTNQLERPPADPHVRSGWLARAWVSVVLIPLFFFAAFALGYVLSDVFGYQPENNNAPFWVDLVVTVVVLAVALAPCLGAVRYGSRARRAGDRGGLAPLVIGGLAGVALTVLTVVTTVADALR